MGILSFFGAKGQSKKLTSELQEKYRNELKRDTKKDFKIEFRRITNLENKILNQYGFDGVKLLFESKNSTNYYQLGEFPKECPWTEFNKKSIKEFIESNFKPISEKVPSLITTLKNRCSFIYAEKKENTWHLHYLLKKKLNDGRDYFLVYTGGKPLLNPKPNKSLKYYKWDIPKDLKLFYKIHNGFARLEYGIAEGVLDNESIYILAKYMNKVSEEDNIKPEGYVFEDLLEFFPDGGGNAQCFYKNNSNVTVFWDHETWEISGETSQIPEEIEFYKFIDKKLSQIDEE